MVYAITANVTWTTKDGWRTSKQIPTFFLDSNIQGIVDVEHAQAIACNILQPTDDFTAHVTAVPCDQAIIVRSLD